MFAIYDTYSNLYSKGINRWTISWDEYNDFDLDKYWTSDVFKAKLYPSSASAKGQITQFINNFRPYVDHEMSNLQKEDFEKAQRKLPKVQEDRTCNFTDETCGLVIKEVVIEYQAGKL